jgi:C4-dicarboxylate-specific signal transduction histidine kinase
VRIALQINGKILLSTSIIILGYLFSMVLSVVVGIENIRLLEDTTDTLFPATRYSQQALSAFENQLKLYENAVVLGEPSQVERAQEYGERVRDSLEQLTQLVNLNMDNVAEVHNFSRKLAAFTRTANEVYAASAAGTLNDPSIGKQMGNLRQEQQVLLKELVNLADVFSKELKQGLKAVVKDTEQGQRLNLLAFVIAIAASSVIMQLAINRLITRPLARTVRMLEDLGRGRLERRLRIDTNDEIGRMARAMDEFADNLNNKVRLAEDIAAGDLSVKVALASEYDTLGEAMNTMAANLKNHQAAIESNIASLEMQAIALKKANDNLTNEIQERKKAQAQLTEMQAQLLETSRQAGMAEVATGVLHNVGNVLNSVNVSATLVADKVRTSQAMGLRKVTNMLKENDEDIGNFLTNDSRGKQLPRYLGLLADKVDDERELLLGEMQTLTKNIAHIKDIVGLQQSYAKVAGVAESLSLQELVEDAVHINRLAIDRGQVQIVRTGELLLPTIMLEKQKVLQILVNLVKNACEAITENPESTKKLFIAIHRVEGPNVQVTVEDTGTGISEDNLTRIFAHGFTTKKTGHGFGLHTGAIAATEMGGSLTASSAGEGKGATFILEMPLVFAGDHNA